MRKWLIGIIVILIMSGTALAAEFTVTLTQQEYDLLTKAAVWRNETRQKIAREAIVDRLNYEKEIRKQQVMFSNESTICAAYNCR